MAETKRGKTRARFVYNGIEYDVDVDAELDVDRENLFEQYRKQPGAYAFYASAYAAAQMEVGRSELSLAVAQSRAADRLRHIPVGTDSKGKPKDPSEAFIDKELPRQQEVIEAKEALINARGQEAVLRALKEAFQHRRDMLIQIGYDQRVEMRT
jgi:hypothetical protein